MPYWDEPGLTWDHPLAHYDDPRTLAQILHPPAAMFDVVLDTANLSVTDLIARIRQIIAGASSQSVFSSMSAFLTALGIKVNTLESDEALLTAAKSTVGARTLTRDGSRESVEDDLPMLATLMGQKALTEQDIINANARVKSAPTPRPIPATPTNFIITAGDEDGEISGQCDGQPRMVDMYEIEWTTTDPNLPNTVWQALTPSLKSSWERKGLPSGQKIWMRTRASNKTGASNWSDPACRRVP